MSPCFKRADDYEASAEFWWARRLNRVWDETSVISGPPSLPLPSFLPVWQRCGRHDARIDLWCHTLALWWKHFCCSWCSNSSEGYTDLATIYTSSDTDQMQMDSYFAWIGLYYNRDTGYWYNGNWYYGYWSWVGKGYNTFSGWQPGEPQSNDNYAVVESSMKK